MTTSEIDAERFRYCGGRAPGRRRPIQRPANSPIPNIEWHEPRAVSRQAPFKQRTLEQHLRHQHATHPQRGEIDTAYLILAAWAAMILGALYVFFA